MNPSSPDSNGTFIDEPCGAEGFAVTLDVRVNVCETAK
jgi:hypothetical protein